MTLLVRLIHTGGVKPNLVEDVFAKAGGRRALQESLGLSKQSMSDWLREGCVPLKHCPKVHHLTGIPLEKLNPAFKVEKVRG